MKKNYFIFHPHATPEEKGETKRRTCIITDEAGIVPTELVKKFTKIVKNNNVRKKYRAKNHKNKKRTI